MPALALYIKERGIAENVNKSRQGGSQQYTSGITVLVEVYGNRSMGLHLMQSSLYARLAVMILGLTSLAMSPCTSLPTWTPRDCKTGMPAFAVRDKRSACLITMLQDYNCNV
jgi:hypothetical protein